MVLSLSPLSLITNFLSNVDCFERYGSNIIGVSGTLGNDADKNFMRETFLVEFATIPTSKRRKSFELDGLIEDNYFKVCYQVQMAIASNRAVLVICEDITTADEIYEQISSEQTKATLYLHTEGVSYDRDKIKPGDVVITTNLGARGTNFVTDDVVNKNGGLFVLVTFIPLNDRVEKQAFGRTGRRGATGSCQIILTRKTMPKWSRLRKTVDEVKRLRDSIEMHRLNNMTEVNLMRNKQKLFREYCDLKHKFVASSNSEPYDIQIQLELLDETWAIWIQDVETQALDWNHSDLMEELRRNSEICTNRAKEFESDNIYHIMKFGEVRLIKGDFEGATKFYDQVIRMDPIWSAFAHYNRAYCTLQMKSDGYIGRAIDDLESTLRRFEAIKKQHLFSEICTSASDPLNRKADIATEPWKLWEYEGGSSMGTIDTTNLVSDRPLYSEIDFNDFILSERDDANCCNSTDRTSPNRYEASLIKAVMTANLGPSLYYTMTKCQLLHHIKTQISDTIKKLETIDAMNGEVTTVRRNNILELIPGADCRIEEMLEEYRQLGLLFIYDIEKEPTFCCLDQNVYSLIVLLHSVYVALLVTFSSEISWTGDPLGFKEIIEDVCNIREIGDDSFGWISQCANEAIVVGILSRNFIRDVSSLLLINQNESKSSFKMTAEKTQFEQFANPQARSISLLLPLARCFRFVRRFSCSRYGELESSFEQIANSQARSALAQTIQKMNMWLSGNRTMEIIILFTTKDKMGLLEKKIQETINGRMAHGLKLHRALCYLYDNVKSGLTCDLHQFANCLRDLVWLSLCSSQQSDIPTAKLQSLAVELISKSRYSTAEITSKITSAVEEIDIESVITKLSDLLVDKIDDFIPKTRVDQYACDDVEMLESTVKVLTSEWSNIICSVVQNKILQSFMHGLHVQTRWMLYSLVKTESPVMLKEEKMLGEVVGATVTSELYL